MLSLKSQVGLASERSHWRRGKLGTFLQLPVPLLHLPSHFLVAPQELGNILRVRMMKVWAGAGAGWVGAPERRTGGICNTVRQRSEVPCRDSPLGVCGLCLKWDMGRELSATAVLKVGELRGCGTLCHECLLHHIKTFLIPHSML